MKLITKYKIFENKTITKENIEELVDNYLVNDKFIIFLKEKGINFNYSREIQFDYYMNNDINIVILYYDKYENMRLRVDISKFKGNDVVECKFSFRYSYNGYRLYDYNSELDFVKKNFDIYDNLKEIFINTNNHMISIPFIGTKKEVDDLESLMTLIVDSKKFPIYLSKDGVQKIKELESNYNFINKLPDELKFLEEIKFMKFFFNDKENIIFLYAKFDHGTELIQVHEQYANFIYKMYKKIINN